MILLEHPIISDQEKAALWQAYREGRHTRVPMFLKSNVRVVMALPDWNPDGYTFEDCYNDPKANLKMELQHMLFNRRVISKHSDWPHELPEVWAVPYYLHNVYEAAAFGAPLCFPPDQVPTTEPPPFADDDRRDDVFDVDIEHPLETPYWKHQLRMWREMKKLAEQMTFEGRPVKVIPLNYLGSDGVVTAGCNLRGPNFLMDLLTEPEYAQKLMSFVVDSVAHRRRALMKAMDGAIPKLPHHHMADDACAMLGVEQWRELVKPHHERLYHIQETDGCGASPDSPRALHMCGNATHLFPAMHDELNIRIFDTGFPVNHGDLRKKLGQDVTIQGGPQVPLLLKGTPEQVFERTREILQSGVMAGKRFVMREAHNLPPHVPEDNLAAMYTAALEFGRYEQD